MEYGWLDAIRTASLFAYRLPAEQFKPFGSPSPHAMVTTEPAESLGPPVEVPNLLELHAAAGIQLRVLLELDLAGGGGRARFAVRPKPL